MGLGAAHRTTFAAAGESLALARRSADKARKQLAEGVDPIAARLADREAAAATVAAAKAVKSTSGDARARRSSVPRRSH
jgi:hypothetical protein